MIYPHFIHAPLTIERNKQGIPPKIISAAQEPGLHYIELLDTRSLNLSLPDILKKLFLYLPEKYLDTIPKFFIIKKLLVTEKGEEKEYTNIAVRVQENQFITSPRSGTLENMRAILDQWFLTAQEYQTWDPENEKLEEEIMKNLL